MPSSKSQFTAKSSKRIEATGFVLLQCSAGLLPHLPPPRQRSVSPLNYVSQRAARQRARA